MPMIQGLANTTKLHAAHVDHGIVDRRMAGLTLIADFFPICKWLTRKTSMAEISNKGLEHSITIGVSEKVDHERNNMHVIATIFPS